MFISIKTESVIVSEKSNVNKVSNGDAEVKTKTKSYRIVQF